LSVIDAELAVMDAKARGDITSEDSVPEEMVEAVLARDQQSLELGNRLSSLEETILFQQQRSARGANEPSVKRLRIQRDQIARRIQERRAELRPQVVSQLSLEGAGGLGRPQRALLY
jgi:hypothetical protein